MLPYSPTSSPSPVVAPADAPRVRPLDGTPRPPVPVALLGEQFDVLGLRVRDPLDVGPDRHDRVDPHPHEVRRVEVEVEAQREHPLPQLWRVGEVAGVPVGVPALHHAVLDDDAYAFLARLLHESREQLLRLAQVLRYAPGRV